MSTDIKEQLDKVRVEHKRLFGEELVKGELNHFFTSLLEYKRRKWIEAALGDKGPEEIIQCLELLDKEGLEDEALGDPTPTE